MPTVDTDLQSTAFSSLFMTSISIAVFGGIIVAFPFIFWEFWKFIKPALTPKEIKNTRGSITFVSFFFFAGVAFGYYLLAPFTFSFLSNYKLGNSNTMIVKPTLDDYLENLIDLIIGCGLAFELPVVVLVLVRFGLVTYEFMARTRPYAIVLIFILATIITPTPDVLTLIALSLPMCLLYESCIWIAWFMQRKAARAESP